MCKYLQYPASQVLDEYLEVELLGQMVILFFTLGVPFILFYHNSCTISPSNTAQGSSFSAFLPILVLFSSARSYSFVVLIDVSLMVRGVRASFHLLVDTLYISGELPVQVFGPFLNWTIIFSY